MKNTVHSKPPSQIAVILLSALALGAITAPAQTSPALTAHPTNQTVSLGATVEFRVTASGAPPLTFEWHFNDAPIAGAPASRLTLTNAQLAASGSYHVLVSNSSGGVTSRVATLRVDPTFTKITSGPVVTDNEPSTSMAWGDYDGDGRLDLFIANSAWLAGGHRNSLYRNLGGDEFVRVTNALTARVGISWGGQWADYDNDGDLDLFVVHPRNGRNELFRNEGNGVFTPLENEATAIRAYYTDVSWVDHDGDGWLDLFVPTQSGAGTTNLIDYFFRNQGDRSFRAWTTNEVGLVTADRTSTAGPAWCDIDGDGDLDLYISNYTGANFLYRNDGGRLVAIAAGSLPAQRSTWAATWGDFNNDGLFDLATGGENGTNTLHLNRGNWAFEDVTVASGLALTGTVFNISAGDFDNDGDLDLYVPIYDRADVLYLNRGDGRFDKTDVGSPLTDGTNDFAIWVDYNKDGLLDLFKTCGDLTPARNLLYRNTLTQSGNSNRWLKVQLKGTVSNASAIGARVRVRATIGGEERWQVQQIASSLYASGAAGGLAVHFGLGDATNVTTLRIEWPSGALQEFSNVATDWLFTATEPIGIQPRHPSASLGGAVTLTNRSLGRYQWSRNGAELASQTNRTLALKNVTAVDAGQYTVVVTLSDGSTQTNHTFVAVDEQFTKINEGPLATDLGNSGYLSWTDDDGDGYPDLAVSRWRAGNSAIYQNAGNGTFTPVVPPFLTTNSGVSPWGDMDGDGRSDLVVWREQETLFYFGESQGNWTPYAFGADSSTWWSLTMADFDRDGLLDLYFTNFGGSRNRFYRNSGNRSLRLMAASEVGPVASTLSFGGAASADFDDDGWPDLYLASFRANRSLMFRNDSTGRFVAVTNLITRTTGASLSGAWGDYDNDGRLDLCVVRWPDTTTVYRNLGAGEFEQTAALPPLTGTHNSASWADYDNDGFLDLFVSGAYSGNKLFRNNGNGTFTRITLGSVVNDRPLLGAATLQGMWFDYDRDGFLDLYVANGDDPAIPLTANFLYHNNPNGNHWLRVRLAGTTSNPQGIGAKVRAQARFGDQVRWQRRDITAGDFYNGNHLHAHFGLREATNVTTLRIEWPSGTVQELSNIAAGQFLTVTEPRRPVLAVTSISALSFTSTLRADPGRTYEMSASDDLASWTLLTTVTTDGSGTGDWSDTGAVGTSHRFYRAQLK